MTNYFKIIACINLCLSSYGISSQSLNLKSTKNLNAEYLRKTILNQNGVIPHFMGNTNSFWYTWENESGVNWIYVDAINKIKKPLFDRKKIAAQLTQILKSDVNEKKLPLADMKYNIKSGLLSFKLHKYFFTYNIESEELLYKVQNKAKSTTNIIQGKYSPDGNWLVYTKNYNLYLVSINDPKGKEHALTTDGNASNSYNGVKWFNDSKKLYLFRCDQRAIPKMYNINDFDGGLPTPEDYTASSSWVYPMKFDLFAFDVNSKSKVTININKWSWQTISKLPWSGLNDGLYVTNESKYIFFLRANFPCTEIEVCRADTNSGEVRVLWSEKNKQVLNTRHIKLNVINNGEEFIWWSDRTGWGHLYRYDSNGNLLNPITKGEFMVGGVAKIDTIQRQLYFWATQKEKELHPFYPHYYRVNFDGSGFKHLSKDDQANFGRLTPSEGIDNFYQSEDGNYLVTTSSTVNSAPISRLRNRNGKILMELEKVDLSKLQSTGYRFPEIITVKAADDSTDLYGVMWKPTDFDSTKLYPVISHVYPGPFTMSYPLSFSSSFVASNGFFPSLADKGFIIVALGNRGDHFMSPKKYRTFGYGNIRDYALQDNKYAIEQLCKNNSFMDINRIGVYGYSAGGGMAVTLMLTYPNFYKVGISGAGAHNGNIPGNAYEPLYQGFNKHKIVMNSSDKNRSLKDSIYFDFNIKTNLELSSNLKGKLFLIHGTRDTAVNIVNTYQIANALINKGKQFDMFVFPNGTHDLIWDDNSNYYHSLIENYFLQHLKNWKNSDFQ